MIDDQLLALYQATSKHSNYQILPNALKAMLPASSLATKSRYERERLEYIASRLDLIDCCIADIGGNTGYFSFELLAHGASAVTHIEGNTAHHQFVLKAAAKLGLEGRLQCENRYIDFDKPNLAPHETVFLLNVLHHVGDDYGDPTTRIETVQSKIKAALRKLAPTARHLVLQLGFNWKGDPNLPIFASGTKAEVINLVRELEDVYLVQAIGIAGQNEDGLVVYRDLDALNITRDDRLGEFLNRPLFILRSRSYETN
jgi:hypothetical protein